MEWRLKAIERRLDNIEADLKRNGWSKYQRQVDDICDDWPDFVKWRGKADREIQFCVLALSAFGGALVAWFFRALG